MLTVAKAGALVLFAALAGCAFDDVDPGNPDNAPPELLQKAAQSSNVSMCRFMEARLAGTTATFFKVRDYENFVVLVSNGEVICIDEAPVILRAGVIPVTNESEPSCSFCDGTPLPAEKVEEMARKWGEQRTEL